ncbi:MAG: response regulator transcription factor [Dehalococcoidia bacterium]
MTQTSEQPERVIRVLLADDHAMFRRGIAQFIGQEADMEVVGEAEDGHQAVEMANRLRPDVAVLDIRMPGLSGVEATGQISGALPDTRVLMLTVYDDEDFLFRSVQAGAFGYLLKEADVEDLLLAIRTVHAGEIFMYPSMAAKVMQDYVRRLQTGEGGDTYENLSAREREVLPMVADGSSTQEIAGALEISPYTVQTYKRRIMRKLNLQTRKELLSYALRRGLIQLEGEPR